MRNAKYLIWSLFPFYLLWNLLKTKCLFGHKWEYGTEEVTYSQLLRPDRKASLLQKSRYCRKCSSKQIQMIGGKWMDWSLSIDEERDKKLNELGI